MNINRTGPSTVTGLYGIMHSNSVLIEATRFRPPSLIMTENASVAVTSPSAMMNIDDVLVATKVSAAI